MKTFLSALLMVFFSIATMAQMGLVCEDPIPVDENYSATIAESCERWYVANTYDLPLHVYFSPFSDNSTRSPEVTIDFTCEYGRYEDPKLDSLINTITDFGLEFPVEIRCDLVVRNGRNEWDLSIDKSYRERIAEYGITYNLQAIVKVFYPEGGTITLKPDTLFKNCLETADFIQLGDTIEVLPNDVERVFVVSYADWQNDSTRFVWVGDGEARVWLAETMCAFEPSLVDPFVWTYFDISEANPYKLYTEQMKDDIKNHSGGGIFFGKVMSSSKGKLVVEKIPKSKPKGDAELLEYGKSVVVTINDTNKLYCIPKNWTSTEFLSSVNCGVELYVSNQIDFSANPNSTNLLGVYSFYQDGPSRHLLLSTKEIANLANQSVDGYIYLRFKVPTTTSILPNAWETLGCLDNTVMIDANVGKAITNKANSTVYRFRYSDFSGYDLTIKWNGNGILPIYLSDTCQFELSSKDPNVLLYSNIARRGSLVVSAATLEEWSSLVGSDGYLYVRFNPSVSSRVTFMTDKPVSETPDPVYTTLTDTVCYGVTYEWNDQKYTTSGEYSQTFTAANGADSVVTLTLVVLPKLKPVVTEQTIEYGKSFEWNNKVYTQSTTDTVTLQNEHGCDYLAILKLTVLDKPASPCVLKSIELKINDQLTLNLDSAFTIYRINYSEWVATGATLTWTGVEPLHTFVAETCEFAVAPYNKYVHAYVSVPAEGALAMTKAMLADMAEFVDEDGYLYVRFLTEQEGVLEVK